MLFRLDRSGLLLLMLLVLLCYGSLIPNALFLVLIEVIFVVVIVVVES